MLLIIIVASIVLGWLPVIIAMTRNHNNKWAIFWTWLLLSWTVIGWFVAFIWACTNATVRIEYANESKQ